MSLFKANSDLLQKVAEAWSTCLFVGYVKFMPGTLCSILSVIILYFCEISCKKNIAIFLFLIVFIVSLFFVKIFIEKVNQKDPSFVVIDEFLGVFLGIILFLTEYSIRNYIVFLILFRIFDIFKPFPVNFLDRLSKTGGTIKQSFFIIADDLAAGVMASLTLLVLEKFRF